MIPTHPTKELAAKENTWDYSEGDNHCLCNGATFGPFRHFLASSRRLSDYMEY
jgi:hypothetical protein